MTDLPTLQTGLHAVVRDAREFAAGVRFAHPDLLWLTLAPAVLSVVGVFANRQNRRDAAAIGQPGAVAALVTGRRRPSRIGAVTLFFAWTLLVFGAAGPMWGPGGEAGVAVGRDVVVVLDFSRSMLADDAADGGKDHARWRAAVAGAEDLVEALRARGGHRAAVVVFAARPKLLAPLTTDYDHLRATLAGLDANFPPLAIRPADDAAKSGTRIGAALAAAVAAHDPQFAGFQDVILISDGDDPADDREWSVGVTAARKANVPVHTVGVGDPAAPGAVIVVGETVLDARTRLREDVLKAVAVEARGFYLPARTDPAKVGDFYRAKVEPNPNRVIADDLLPQPKDRSAWFLAAGLAFLLTAWWRETRRG